MVQIVCFDLSWLLDFVLWVIKVSLIMFKSELVKFVAKLGSSGLKRVKCYYASPNKSIQTVSHFSSQSIICHEGSNNELQLSAIS